MRCGGARICAVIAFALSVAGCNTTGQQAGGLATGQRTTIAFESIDGPPAPVFQRLVRKLSDEAEARQVPVVTREGFAPYRIRGYVAIGVRKRQTVVSWVWDVYDAQAGRTLRLSGEEKAGPAGRGGWQSVNDEVLSRIARSGMEQLAVYFRGPATTPDAAPVTPEDRPSAIARNDDFQPESHGIFRRSAAPEAPSDTTASTGPAEATAPIPPRRPAAKGGRVASVEPAR